MKARVWSCGGGRQSAAILAQMKLGNIAIPDAASIANTGREKSATWRYVHGVLQPEAQKLGFEITEIPHSFDGTGWNTRDWVDSKGKPLIPAFSNRDGEVGQTAKYCSNEWKSRPCERYYKSLGIQSADVIIGFSADEPHRWRAYDPEEKWNQVYPLMDLGMTKNDCIALVLQMGWPPPPTTSCYVCPYNGDSEWLVIKRHDPEDFAKAVQEDRRLRQIDPDLYLHRSCKPLDQVDFNEAQTDMFDECSGGQCFT